MTRICVIGAGFLLGVSYLMTNDECRRFEHTSPDWSGTIEGALTSGERAAADVVRLVRSS